MHRHTLLNEPLHKVQERGRSTILVKKDIVPYKDFPSLGSEVLETALFL